MSIAICHYHLQPGGVSRIIQSQVQALNDCGFSSDLKLICGFFPDRLKIPNVRIIVDSALDYLPRGASPEMCFYLRDKITSSLTAHLARSDILHIHNPNLGKNPVLTFVLYQLAHRGYRLFYHCHDFSEDRKQNFAFNKKIIEDTFGQDLKEVMYPDTGTCAFGTLNSRDVKRLEAMGIDERRIHYLPNPVSFREHPDERNHPEIRRDICRTLGIPEEKPIFLYPVRVIRRKNIGEFILLASLFGDESSWLVTLAPHNPAERAAYQMWKDFAREEKIRVGFDVGHAMEFHQLMHSADRIISTSIQEGFGMSFLEPWLFDKPVVGRNIPYVTEDFRAEGIVFESLYDSLPVTDGNDSADFATLLPSEQMRHIRHLKRQRNAGEEFLRNTGLRENLFRKFLIRLPRETND